MSREAHEAAMEVWERLKGMDEESAREKALDDGSEMNEVWATARISSMVLKSLGMAPVEEEGEDPDDNPDLVLWQKTYGRPLAKVYAHYIAQKDRIPEERVHALSKFAAKYKPLDAALDDLLPHIRKQVA